MPICLNLIWISKVIIKTKDSEKNSMFYKK